MPFSSSSKRKIPLTTATTKKKKYVCYYFAAHFSLFSRLYLSRSLPFQSPSISLSLSLYLTFRLIHLSMKALFNGYSVLPKVHYAAYEMNNFSFGSIHARQGWVSGRHRRRHRLPRCILYAKRYTEYSELKESCAQVSSSALRRGRHRRPETRYGESERASAREARCRNDDAHLSDWVAFDGRAAPPKQFYYLVSRFLCVARAFYSSERARE